MKNLAAASADTIRRAQTGDARAWEKLVSDYAGPVYGLCYRFAGTPDQAEDLSQEVFMKLFQALNHFDPLQGSFSTWMLSVVRNLLIDQYRKGKAREWVIPIEEASTERGLEERIASSAPGPHRQAEASERIRLLSEALSRLPRELREAVVLRDIQEFSYSEIAGMLNLPEGTVKSRINRGRIELAKTLRQLKYFT
ncbi:MAG TPA: sigma-70 family RNA polymerase sigma factor [Acidobacteriota bacterium]|nr:sigma-70 family RNA polymerase sigma factor [Acidobacteriota bacterium]